MSHVDTTIAILGKHGFYFLDGDSNHVIRQIEGKLFLNSRQTFLWVSLIKSRALLLGDMNVEYLFIVPPNKETILKDFLPDNILHSSLRPVKQISQSLGLYSKYLYYEDRTNLFLNDDLTINDLYPRGETHWTDRFGYEYLKIALSGTSFSPVPESLLDTFEVNLKWYDLGSKTNANYVESIICIRPKEPRSRKIQSNNLKNIGHMEVWENLDKTLPKAVVFRDSFFSNLICLFSESFSRVVYVWHPWIDYELVSKEKPDIVISCSIERFLVNMPCDFTGPSYKQIEASKRS